MNTIEKLLSRRFGVTEESFPAHTSSSTKRNQMNRHGGAFGGPVTVEEF